MPRIVAGETREAAWNTNLFFLLEKPRMSPNPEQGHPKCFVVSIRLQDLLQCPPVCQNTLAVLFLYLFEY
jgi:hypothetical protein